MKTRLLTALVLFASVPAQGQMSVDSFAVSGGYDFIAFSGSASGTFDIGPQPGPYDETIPEATLSDESGVFSATFNGGLESELLPNGFRLFGTIFAEEPLFPFYEQSHTIFASTRFELTEPTLVRISGSILHDPTIVSDEIVILNGTGFSLQGEGTFTTESAGPIGQDDPLNEFDRNLLLPAGTFMANIDSFSRVGGFSPGLTSVNTQWDITVTVVPAPPGLGLIAGGLLLASRRRR